MFLIISNGYMMPLSNLHHHYINFDPELIYSKDNYLFPSSNVKANLDLKE